MSMNVHENCLMNSWLPRAGVYAGGMVATKGNTRRGDKFYVHAMWYVAGMLYMQ
jgi:hypothetical protein